MFVSSSSGIMTSRRQVIRSDAELQAAWSEATSAFLSDGPAPDVDFEADLVLLVAMGERPSGGYRVDVSSVVHQADTVYATVEETEPGASCVTTATLTQPVLMLRIPAVGTEVVFIEDTAVLDCS